MDKKTRINLIVAQFLGGRFSADTEERIQRWLVEPRDEADKEAASREFWDSLDAAPTIDRRSWRRVSKWTHNKGANVSVWTQDGTADVSVWTQDGTADVSVWTQDGTADVSKWTQNEGDASRKTQNEDTDVSKRTQIRDVNVSMWTHRPKTRRWASIAAAIAIPLMAVAGGWFYYQAEVRENQLEQVEQIEVAATKLAAPLTFENTDLQEITAEIEHRFGVQIEAPREFYYTGRRYTARFTGVESLTEVLDVLAATVGFSYTINGEIITIDK